MCSKECCGGNSVIKSLSCSCIGDGNSTAPHTTLQDKYQDPFSTYRHTL